MCVAAALANAIGIETKNPKCAGRSEAGLVANSREGRGRETLPLNDGDEIFDWPLDLDCYQIVKKIPTIHSITMYYVLHLHHGK